jgi:hypothetical protein
VATFTIILGTGGRPTIKHTLKSIAGQLEPGDELFVVRDDSGDAGDTPRNLTMHRAAGTHLLFIDDDDEYVPDALATMRRFADENPGRIGIFRMKHPTGPHHWRTPELRYANVSTQLFCVPNIPDKLGEWKEVGRRAGDFRFIKFTSEFMGQEPIFVDAVTVRARPIRNPLKLAWTKARYSARLGTRLREARTRLRAG